MITQARLKEVLRYDMSTGWFTWLVTLNARGPQGSQAGCIAENRKGYRVLIGIDGKMYLAHRLVWMYMYGRWPKAQIDHIDGNALNNSFANLREADNSQNHQNLKSARADNKSSKLLGVSKNYAGHWRARIWVKGKETSLGTFSTAQEAHQAYVEAKRKLHPFGML